MYLISEHFIKGQLQRNFILIIRGQQDVAVEAASAVSGLVNDELSIAPNRIMCSLGFCCLLDFWLARMVERLPLKGVNFKFESHKRSVFSFFFSTFQLNRTDLLQRLVP